MADGETKITLHWLNGSRAQGTLWLLEELQVPYELKLWHRQKSQLAPPELAKIHPLGKSPVIEIQAPGLAQPLVLAESAYIVHYMSQHFTSARNLVPKRWKDGQEGNIGGETEEWTRSQYLMYYTEGSFMQFVLLYFVFSGIKGPNVPFFIRPITRLVANQVIAMLIFPTLRSHFTMMEKFLETSPGGGKYICGQNLSGADIMLAYPLISGSHGLFDDIGNWEKGTWKDTFPKLFAYVQTLESEPGWVRSTEKIKSLEGSFSLLP